MRISDWSSDVCSSDLQSGLPAGKTFATFDFDAAPGIRKPHLLSLAAGDDWIESGGNLLLFGQSGTGKTHAVAANGHALIDAGRRVLFCSTTDMVQKLQAARRDLSLPAMLDKLDTFDLKIGRAHVKLQALMPSSHAVS